MDGKPEQATFQEWMAWMQSSFDAKGRDTRVVSYTKVGDVQISTVFLGLDHNYGTRTPHVPVLYETMVFNGYLDGYQARHPTKEAALVSHRQVVREVQAVNAVLDYWYERLRDAGIV